LASTRTTDAAHNTAALNENQAGRSWGQIIFPWILVVVAWGIVLLAFATNRASLIDHDYLLRTSHLPWLVAFVVFLISWQVMTVAMMLPSALSMVSAIGALSRGRGPLWLVQGSFILGYTFVWTLFACVAFPGDTLVHQLVDHWRWLYIHSWFIGATVLLVAGSFQLSPLKRSCLQHCCHEATVYTALPGSSHIGLIWRMGVRYGLFCLGACWAIMLVMFGIGMKSLFWIVALTGVMLVEKEIPGGQRLRVVIGGGFLFLAVLWLLLPLLG
jgi:predicted metal-binding membrane protein